MKEAGASDADINKLRGTVLAAQAGLEEAAARPGAELSQERMEEFKNQWKESDRHSGYIRTNHSVRFYRCHHRSKNIW